MAIKEETKIINGASYVVQQFAARRGLMIKAKLIKMIAPTVFAFIDMVSKAEKGNDILNADVNTTVIASAIQGMIQNLEKDGVVSFVFELLSNTRRDNQEIWRESIFDEVYAGNYGELFQALKFVVEVNYKSFFQDLGIGKKEVETLKSITNKRK